MRNWNHFLNIDLYLWLACIQYPEGVCWRGLSGCQPTGECGALCPWNQSTCISTGLFQVSHNFTRVIFLLLLVIASLFHVWYYIWLTGNNIGLKQGDRFSILSVFFVLLFKDWIQLCMCFPTFRYQCEPRALPGVLVGRDQQVEPGQGGSCYCWWKYRSINIPWATPGSLQPAQPECPGEEASPQLQGAQKIHR